MPLKELPANRIQRIFSLLAILSLVSIGLGLFALQYKFHDLLGDVQLYYNYARGLMNGQVPYRDLPLEYPSLALLPMVLPQLVNFGQQFSLLGYIGLFLLENVIFTTLVALLLLRVRQYLQPYQHSLWVLRVLIILVAISAPLLCWRYDIFPALLTLLALVSVLTGYPTMTGIWLGLGITAKLYPVVLLPIFSAYYLASNKNRGLLRFLLSCISTTCIIFLPFALSAGSNMLSFIRYHQQRGLQIESVPAGLVSLAHVLGLTKASTVFNYGASHMVSPLADTIQKWLPLISILAFVAVISCCLSSFRREYAATGVIKPESLVIYVTAALLTFMATGKVFSTQYIIWLLPFVPLLRPRKIVLAIAIFALTIYIFFSGHDRLKLFYTFSVLLLNLRNLLVVFLTFLLLIEGASGNLKDEG